MATSFVLEGVELVEESWPATQRYPIAFNLGLSLGSPEAIVASVLRAVQDGSSQSGRQSDDREVSLPLSILSTDSKTRGACQDWLFRTVNQPTFAFTITPDGGLPVVGRGKRGSLAVSFDDVAWQLGDQGATLTFRADPFLASTAPVVLSGGAAVVQTDAMDSTTAHTVQTGGTLAVSTASFVQGTGSLVNTFTDGVAFTVGGISFAKAVWFASSGGSLSLSGLDVVTFRTWVNPTGGNAYGGGNLSSPKRMLLLLTTASNTYGWFGTRSAGNNLDQIVPDRSGWGTVSFDISAPPDYQASAGAVSLSAVTGYQLVWELDTTRSATSLDWYGDDLKAASSTPPSPTAANGTLAYYDILGSARVPVGLEFAPISGGQDLLPMLVSSWPDATPGYTMGPLTSPAKAAWYTGPFVLWVKVTSCTVDAVVQVVFTTGADNSTPAISRTVQGLIPAGTVGFIALDEVALPPRPADPANTTATFTWTGPTTIVGTVTLASGIYLTSPQASTVALGLAGSNGYHVYLDPPADDGTLEMPATGSSRLTALRIPDVEIGQGAILFEPGDNLLFVATSASSGFTSTVTYTPLWFGERAA